VTLAAKVQNATETLGEISAGAREKVALNFLFTAANKLLFAQWRRGDPHDFVWEHCSSNFFENFSCHHNM
jgi:hypothetical protein